MSLSRFITEKVLNPKHRYGHRIISDQDCELTAHLVASVTAP